MNSFKAAMSKLTILGHDSNDLINCAEAVPLPKPPVSENVSFPATTGPQDIQQACPLPFPSSTVDGECLSVIQTCAVELM